MSVDDNLRKPEHALKATIDYSAKVNFALQQNDVPTVREIRIENTGEQSLSDLSVSLTTASGASKSWEQRLLRLNPGESRTLTRIDLQFDSAHLANLLERERTDLILTVRRGEETLWSSSHPLEVLAFNEWPGLSVLPEIIAAFVGPNHPALSPAITASRARLQQWTGDGALNGYQSASPDRCYKMLAAAYQALREQAIGYINPPASFEQEGQKVRTADQVIGGDRSATCLDLTVVAAALLEQMGLHPLVIFTKGHAFVGAWLTDTQFSEPSVDDASRISNRVALNEIGVFETTVLCDGKNIAFDDAARMAMRHLEKSDTFLACIDIRAARRARILPLPPRVRSGNGFLVVEHAPAAATTEADNVPALDTGGPSANSVRSKHDRYRELGLPEESLRRLDLWKRKLLDLSLRNPMLNFRVKTRSLELLIPDIAALEDRLAGGKAFSLLSKSDLLREDAPRDLQLETQRSGRDIPTEVLREEFTRGVLRADASADTLTGKLVELFRTTRTNIEESGSNTLFLALGSLTWYETDKSEEPKCAPLLLVPVKIERPHPQQFRLQAIDEEARVNVTLIEKIRQDFRLDASHLVELEEDDSGVDVNAMLRGFRQVIKDMRRWEVRETAYLGTFSFAKFVLWTDLDQRLEKIAANPTVKFILSRAAEGNQFADFPTEQSIDHVDPAQAALCPLDADSSQQAAIEAAIAGKTFVLQGPPGTGKSQTITNLIARAAAGGKRVLFVAEKLAALSVVRTRLQKVGLGPYTLELHSNKGGKKEVIEQLRTALEASPSTSDSSWSEEVSNLAALRKRLNEYVAAMHTVRPSGEKVYDVMSRMTSLSDAPVIDIKFESALNLSASHLNTLRATVNDAAGAAKVIGEVANHPLKGIRATRWRLDIADQAREALESGKTVVGVMRAALTDWLAFMGVSPELALSIQVGDLAPLYNLTKLLLQRDRARGALFAAEQWQALCNSMPAVAKAGGERDALRAQLLATYAPSVFAIDHQQWNHKIKNTLASNAIMRWFKIRKLLQEFQPNLAAGQKAMLGQISVDLAKIARVNELSAEVQRSPLSFAEPTLAGGVATTDWQGLEAEAKWAAEIHAHLAKLATPGLASASIATCIGQLVSGGAIAPRTDARRAAESFIDATKAFQKSIDELSKVLQASVSELTGQKVSPVIEAFEQTVTRWASGLHDLREWTAWQEVVQREGIAELKPLFAAMTDGTVAPAQVRRAFEAAYAKTWLNSHVAAEPALNRFTYEGRTRLIDDFRQSDRRVMKMSGTVLAKAVASGRPAASLATANATSELGILKRQLQLQRNHKPVRRLVKELPTVLPKLKPIWLMSPLSVAQFLDPSTPPFDLVVFDEASQIPVWDAIGALARGAKAVVVGDSKQLPPTNFFQRQEEEEADPDDDQVEELESILDECVAADFPELRLRWHYRSRHESLIAFSNHQYYDNHLLTFPSSDASVTDRLGVRLEHVKDGRYDRGGSRTNEIEAKAVVAELFKRLSGKEPASIGIVTFSVAQQKQVEDLIDVELKSKPDLRSRFDPKEPEYVFVKNLENVQGDERDIIFFSICYGMTAAGKSVQSFGPINRDGGERRLNVAVTRARRQVVVFSSIKAENISLSTSRSRGLADLKHFLDYAERGPRALLKMQSVAGIDQFDSPFEQEVCRAVRDRGWTVDTQVGCSGYRIDMAVQDPAKPGRYLLGIECDGASYHSAATARDRDRLREDVLRGLGWHLHRVWSTDWLQNRQKALHRLILAIEAAQVAAAEAAAAKPTDANETISVAIAVESPEFIQSAAQPVPIAAPVAMETQSRLPRASDYVTHKFSSAIRSAAAFYIPASDQRLSDDLVAVIATEAPIHLDELNSRVAQAWGLMKVTKRVESRLEELRHRLRLTATDEFYRLSRPENGIASSFRVPPQDDQRAIEYVSPEELKCAAVAVLNAQFGLPAAELEREVARQFGLQRPREASRRHIRGVVEALLNDGLINATDGIIRVN